MIQGSYEFIDKAVAGPAFHSDRSLSNGRQTQLHRQDLGDSVCPAESLYPCCRKDNGVELSLIQLPQPRVKVAPQLLYFEVGSHTEQLAGAAKAARADRGPPGQALKVRDPEACPLFA